MDHHNGISHESRGIYINDRNENINCEQYARWLL